MTFRLLRNLRTKQAVMAVCGIHLTAQTCCNPMYMYWSVRCRSDCFGKGTGRDRRFGQLLRHVEQAVEVTFRSENDCSRNFQVWLLKINHHLRYLLVLQKPLQGPCPDRRLLMSFGRRPKGHGCKLPIASGTASSLPVKNNPNNQLR